MQTNHVRAVAAILLGATVSAWSADFTVVNTSNAGAGSLRQSIIDANETPGKDRVLFNIPGPGLQVIRVTAALPVISDPVEIDGYSQPGSRPNELAKADNAVRRIELEGVTPGSDGLVLRTSHSMIRGLSIRRFIGAVSIEGSSNVVIGNKLGSDEAPSFYTLSDSVPGNTRGIEINGFVPTCCNAIGSAQRADRNVIAGNNGNAILIGDGPLEVGDTRIVGNFLGVDSSGVRPSVNYGNATISIYSVKGLWIGGVEEGAGNVVSSGAVSIKFHRPFYEAAIIGNSIGVGADGVTSFSNNISGISFEVFGDAVQPILPVNCRIEDNVIANCVAGIRIYDGFLFPATPPSNPVSADQITISRNSIHSNTNGPASSSYGILLGGDYTKVNDLLDVDVGANNRQNYPELNSAGYAGGNTVVAGVLNSAPFSTYRVEFFANPVAHPSGFGEGEFFLGSTNVTTDFIGSAPFEMTFAGVLSLQSYMTATATDAEGNTSMFSRWMQARSLAAPLFHLNPKPVTVMPYTNIVFRADGSGAGPLSLQWRRNGIDLLGATNFTLSLSNVVWEDRGTYVLVASNSFGVTESLAAELVVIAQPTILAQPVDAIVPPGTNVTFRLQAGGMLPLAYQWRRDGVPLPGETNSSLALSNVNWTMSGGFSATVSNAFGVVESAPAGLFVKMRPSIIQHPISQSVASGAVAYLSVAVTNSATLPLTYLWRSNNLVVAARTSMKRVSVFPIGPVVSNASYTVIVSNSFGAPGVLSLRANLVVLPDADGDGLPDAFEDAYGLDRNSAADAGLDLDGDGATNGAEYAAGTDPADALNQLRIANIRDDAGAAEIEFGASSNKTYTVEFREALGQGTWQPLINLPARETNRVERLMDVKPGVRRFYRLLTPATP